LPDELPPPAGPPWRRSSFGPYSARRRRASVVDRPSRLVARSGRSWSTGCLGSCPAGSAADNDCGRMGSGCHTVARRTGLSVPRLRRTAFWGTDRVGHSADEPARPDRRFRSSRVGSGSRSSSATRPRSSTTRMGSCSTMTSRLATGRRRTARPAIRACLLDHVTGSRSQILIEAMSTVPAYMYSRLS